MRPTQHFCAARRRGLSGGVRKGELPSPEPCVTCARVARQVRWPIPATPLMQLQRGLMASRLPASLRAIGFLNAAVVLLIGCSGLAGSTRRKDGHSALSAYDRSLMDASRTATSRRISTRSASRVRRRLTQSRVPGHDEGSGMAWIESGCTALRALVRDRDGGCARHRDCLHGRLPSNAAGFDDARCCCSWPARHLATAAR